MKAMLDTLSKEKMMSKVAKPGFLATVPSLPQDWSRHGRYEHH